MNNFLSMPKPQASSMAPGLSHRSERERSCPTHPAATGEVANVMRRKDRRRSNAEAPTIAGTGAPNRAFLNAVRERLDRAGRLRAQT